MREGAQQTLFALGNPLGTGPEPALLFTLDEAERRWVPHASHGDFRTDHDAVVVGGEPTPTKSPRRWSWTAASTCWEG